MARATQYVNEREISLTWLCYAAHTAEPTLNGRHLKLEKQMNDKEKQDIIGIVWETLNGVLYDLTEGNPADAVEAVEDMIALLEEAGANPEGESK